MATAIPPLKESEKIELGYAQSLDKVDQATPATIVVASYNIRYAVGSQLISGGLMRKLGFGRQQRRANLVAQNLRSAALAFSERRLLPEVDVLALQEADKSTIRAGRHHVARELA